MEESQHVREGIDNPNQGLFRVLAGLVGLVALLYVAVELIEPFSLILKHRGQHIAPIGWVVIVTTPTGWGGLVYACWVRSGRITGTALAFVLALGVCGMAISFIASVDISLARPLGEILMWIVFLTGTWILNGLGIVWIVHKARRMMVASNTDEADAPR